MLSVRFFASASVFSASALLLPLHPVAAQTPALGFTSAAYGFEDNASDALGSASGSYSLGFEFTANSPVFVTSLGYFNDPSFNSSSPQNFLTLNPAPTGSYSYADSHQVGLYQVVPTVGATPESGLLLASATITSADTPTGDFLYHTLAAPVTLIKGDQYVLAGVSGPTDPFVFNIVDDSQPGGVGLTQSSALTYDQDRYAVSSTLAFPGSTDAASEPGFFGPNMKTSPVPEASTTLSLGLMLGLGLAGLGLRVRRRSRLNTQL